jgi:diguanylate cyclase (GGDEF)-like protein
MTTDLMLTRELKRKQTNLIDVLPLNEALERADGFDATLHKKLLKNALSKADDLRLHTDSMGQLVALTLSALEKAHHELAEAKIKISELEQLATTDNLTELLNRRGFEEAFDRELDKTERGISEGGLLIMIDLDNFKAINDTHGHAAGDEALKLVGETLKQQIRRMDVAARFGGDEFVLLLSNAGRNRALDRAQGLALKLNSLVLRWQGHEIPVRASIGIKDYTKGDTQEDIFEQADATMYEAKAASKAQNAEDALIHQIDNQQRA